MRPLSCNALVVQPSDVTTAERTRRYPNMDEKPLAVQGIRDLTDDNCRAQVSGKRPDTGNQKLSRPSSEPDIFRVDASGNFFRAQASVVGVHAAPMRNWLVNSGSAMIRRIEQGGNPDATAATESEEIENEGSLSALFQMAQSCLLETLDDKVGLFSFFSPADDSGHKFRPSTSNTNETAPKSCVSLLTINSLSPSRHWMACVLKWQRCAARE